MIAAKAHLVASGRHSGVEREAAQRNALRRALALGGAAAVARIRFGLYWVASASLPGAVHLVSVEDRGRYRCSCAAGIARRPVCWHRAAVYIAKIEHAGKGRVTGPTGPAAAPLPSNVVDNRPRRAA